MELGEQIYDVEFKMVGHRVQHSHMACLVPECHNILHNHWDNIINSRASITPQKDIDPYGLMHGDHVQLILEQSLRSLS